MKYPQANALIHANADKQPGELAEMLQSAFPEIPKEKEQWRSFARDVLRAGPPAEPTYREELTAMERELLYKLRAGKLRPKCEPEKPKQRNVLVIGDLHEPFCLDEYLQFNIDLARKYNVTDVIFIGDVIDNHFSSYHETDPDGFGAGEELDRAIARLKRWYTSFPNATVVIGNHDRLVYRKAQTGGIARKWIKPYSEVLEVPKWNFVESIEIDGVLYIHGEGGTARNRIKQELQSTVQGHLHTQAYVDWIVGAKYRVFGMQVGCGVNRKAYALAYAKAGKKPAISSGLVLEDGRLPVVEMMEL